MGLCQECGPLPSKIKGVRLHSKRGLPSGMIGEACERLDRVIWMETFSAARLKLGLEMLRGGAFRYFRGKKCNAGQRSAKRVSLPYFAITRFYSLVFSR